MKHVEAEVSQGRGALQLAADRNAQEAMCQR